MKSREYLGAGDSQAVEKTPELEASNNSEFNLSLFNTDLSRSARLSSQGFGEISILLVTNSYAPGRVFVVGSPQNPQKLGLTNLFRCFTIPSFGYELSYDLVNVLQNRSIQV